jgi:hypothetical protein
MIALRPATRFSVTLAVERSSCTMQKMWGRRSRHRRIEYFWLCGKCCSAMHLMRGRDGAVRIVSLPCLPILMSL